MEAEFKDARCTGICQTADAGTRRPRSCGAGYLTRIREQQEAVRQDGKAVDEDLCIDLSMLTYSMKSIEVQGGRNHPLLGVIHACESFGSSIRREFWTMIGCGSYQQLL